MFDPIQDLARSHLSLQPATVEKARELWRKTANCGIKLGRPSVCLFLASEIMGDVLDKDSQQGLRSQGGFKSWSALVRESKKVGRSLLGSSAVASNSELVKPASEIIHKFFIRNGCLHLLDQALGLFDTFVRKYRLQLPTTRRSQFDKARHVNDSIFAGVVCFGVLVLFGTNLKTQCMDIAGTPPAEVFKRIYGELLTICHDELEDIKTNSKPADKGKESKSDVSKKREANFQNDENAESTGDLVHDEDTPLGRDVRKSPSARPQKSSKPASVVFGPEQYYCVSTLPFNETSEYEEFVQWRNAIVARLSL
ncbi:MAG: hypothetical protein SGCHY_001856 [Lobulomycetales sp.]